MSARIWFCKQLSESECSGHARAQPRNCCHPKLQTPHKSCVANPCTSDLKTCAASTVEEKHCPNREAHLAGIRILSMASPIHRRMASASLTEHPGEPLGSATNQQDQAWQQTQYQVSGLTRSGFKKQSSKAIVQGNCPRLPPPHLQLAGCVGKKHVVPSFHPDACGHGTVEKYVIMPCYSEPPSP